MRTSFLVRSAAVAAIAVAVLPARAATLSELLEYAESMFYNGEIDPTNIPVLSGDFVSLSASIAPTEMTKMVASTAHKTATGTGVTVAVLDSGFNLSHVALTGKLSTLRWDAIQFDSDPNDYGNGIDDDADGYVDLGVGHGTMVASLIARTAPNAKIVPIRVADDEGRGSAMWTAEGLRYAIEKNVHVINVSSHLDRSSSTVSYYLDMAESKGIVVVCAAGNDGVVTSDPLAKAATTLAVGAVDGRDKRASFSNYGANVNLYAPGVLPQGAFGKASTKNLCKWSGTSFATPFVSGAAALLRQRRPLSTTWTALAVRNALISSVDPITAFAGESLTGGRLNLAKVVKK
jgi:thermitase